MKRVILFTLTLTMLSGLTAVGVLAEKPGTIAAVNLKAVIEPTDSSGSACQILSDGGGPYVHGQEGVSASFDNSGDLIINFQTGKTPIRGVAFDYSVPYTGLDNDPPTTPKQPVSGTYPRAFLSTIPQNNDGSYIPLQSLSIGASECVQLSWFYTLNDAKKTQWRHNFHRTSSASGLDVSQTAYGVVTRIDADTWEVEPAGTAACNNSVPEPALARLKDTPTVGALRLNNDGLYSLRFKLTLLRK
ncbi:MAG: hypothetical protein AABO57_09015 [Acidobacteriota bacterium]